MDHVVVETPEELVLQFLAVNQIPLAARVFIRPAVAFAREVNPFRMAELVAHEVEVAAVDGGERHQAYHLVQRHSALHCEVVVSYHHVPIHVGIYKSENYCLVAHESLVVAFGVVDCLFVGAAVGQFPEYRRGFPVLVFLFLDGLYPEIGYAHRHTVVEADAAVAELVGQPRHSAHLLRYCYCVRVDFVYQLVGKRQIGDGVGVLSAVVVVVVGGESLSQSVVVVEHRGHAVETEAVEFEFLKPVFAVRQQEVQHLVLAVVEA